MYSIHVEVSQQNDSTSTFARKRILIVITAEVRCSIIVTSTCNQIYQQLHFILHGREVQHQQYNIYNSIIQARS